MHLTGLAIAATAIAIASATLASATLATFAAPRTVPSLCGSH